MHRTRLTRFAAAAAAGLATLAVRSLPASASGSSDGYTFAVIGDIPYGDAAIAAFPKNIAQINADPAVQWVDHLGDIKNGSSVCSDEYFQLIKQDFDGPRRPRSRPSRCSPGPAPRSTRCTRRSPTPHGPIRTPSCC